MIVPDDVVTYNGLGVLDDVVIRTVAGAVIGADRGGPIVRGVSTGCNYTSCWSSRFSIE